MKQHRTMGTALTIAALAVSLAGCTGQEGTSQSPSNSPVTRQVSGYPYTLSVEDAMDQSVIAVEGTVSQVGEPTWNTADRKKPSEPEQSDTLPAMIYTPFRVKVDKSYKGDVGSHLDVKAFGGTVDDDRFVFTDFDYTPRAGDRVVVLVQQVFAEKNGDKLAIPRSLYTVNGTQLTNQFGGDVNTISISEVARASKAK
ncbi:MAG: hypothetical protein Q8S43_04760 [Actinomycetota bacterium]|nr:hypothetical protein [Actinomycetota bacterium]